MRRLKSHLNGLAVKPGKTRRKVNDGNAGTIIRQTTRQNLPRTASVARGGETKKSELKENTGAKTRETKVKTLPQATIVVGGRDKRRKPTENGKVAQPTVPRGREVPSRKRISKEKTKQRASQRKEDKTCSPVPRCE